MKPAARGIAALLGAIVVLFSACSRRPSDPPLPRADQTYTVRGLVESILEPGKPASEFTVKHEPIDNFVDKEGQVVGMGSMAMPFTPAKGLSFQGLRPGDKVELTFEIRWKGNPYMQITHIAKLPPDTSLTFGKAHPPGGSPAADHQK
jgi:hypothetical protein